MAVYCLYMTEAKEIVITFDIKPVPKGRPRLSRFGTTYTPSGTRQFENAIKMEARHKYRDQPLAGPLVVEVNLKMKSPKKPSKAYPRADVDNYAKGVLDACNGVIWIDDSQIVALIVTKEYALMDSIQLTVFCNESLVGQNARERHIAQTKDLAI